jgi:hypothetical protein
MKQLHLKFIAVSLAIVSSLLALTGCGTQSAASSTTSNTTAASTTNTQETSDQSLITSQQLVKSIDIKATKGQQEVNTQINKNLNNMDKSLNALDRSMGSL